MFYRNWKDFQDWYCNKFQRANPLPWQDGMQALLWFIQEGLPENTRVSLIASPNLTTGVNITGAGTPENPYMWAFAINTQPIIDSVIDSAVTPQKLYEITDSEDESTIGAVWAYVSEDGREIIYSLNARTSNLIENALQPNDLLAAMFAKLEGSESIVIDMNEAGTALEVHIDAEIMQKINRALLAPVAAPSELSFVAINTNNSEVLIPQSQVGGGGSQLYLHKIGFLNQSTYRALEIKVISSKSTAYTINDLFTYNDQYQLYQSTGIIERLVSAALDMGTFNWTWAHVPEVVGSTIRVLYRAPGESSSSFASEISFDRSDFSSDQVLPLQ